MRVLLKYVRNCLKKFPNEFLKSLLFSIVISLINIFIIYLIRELLVNIFSNSNKDLGLIPIILIIIIVHAILVGIWYRYLDYFGGLYLKELISNAYQHLNRLDMKIINKYGNSKLKHILYNDVLDIFRVIGHHIPLLFGSFWIVVFSLIVVAIYDYKIALLLLFIFTVGLVISFYSRNKIRKVALNSNKELKNLYGAIDADINSFVSIKSNNLINYCLKGINENIDKFICAAKREDFTISYYNKLIINYNLIASLLFSYLVLKIDNNLEVGNFASLFIIFNSILDQAQTIENLLQQCNKSLVSFNNYDALLNEPALKSGSCAIVEFAKIKFDAVSFGYDEKLILNNFNYEIHKGDALLIKGENGSGKSTFMRLLNYLYSTDAGSIEINDKKLNEYDLFKYRQQILYLSQDEYFLNGNMLNYLVKVCDVDEEKASQVINYLDLDAEFIIDENGANLSAGQRKKLLLAKLLLLGEKRSLILIDEVDAGLDVKTKQLLVNEINKLINEQNKIIIVITHDSNLKISYHKILSL